MKKSIFIIAGAMMLLCLYTFSVAANDSQYRLVKKVHLKGEGFWDYLTVDDATNRLFVSHSTMVQVVDTNSGKLIGTIPHTSGVHGIALAPDYNKGFISDGRDSSVTIFNLKTLKFIVKTAVTGVGPDAIMYDAFSHQVFVFNGRSSNATVIDAKTNKVTATIALDGKPEAPASDEKGLVYVNIEDKSEIAVINVKTLKVERNFSIAPGEEPSGLAIDAETGRLFSVCRNKLMVIADAQTGKVITTVPIGEHVDGAAFDPIMKRVYSSNGDGTVTVVQEINKDTFKVLENIKTQNGARTIALDVKTHHLYLPTAEFGPPAAPAKGQRFVRPSIKPGSFVILDLAPVEN